MPYQTKKEPWAKQKEALAMMQGKINFALLMAMRTGKTKVVLDDFGRLELEGRAEDILVIAPAGVYDTWETAVVEHVGDQLAERLILHRWSASDGPYSAQTRRLENFLRPKDNRPRLLLINVEALSAVPRAKTWRWVSPISEGQ